VTSDRQQARTGLSVTTLTIASLSSLAAALVVSRLWGGGTLIGAAMTPVIVAVVSEGLRRPATVITNVRPVRGARFDPIAEGRAGLREGDLERARAHVPAAAVAERRVHRVSSRGPRFKLPRPRVMAAVATGLLAFVVAGVFLTGSELVLGKSVVSSSKRTTYIPVKRNTSTTKTTTTDTTPTTSTATQTQSTTAPTTTTTAPQAAPPTTTTAPPATTVPPQSAAPAPTPAPATPTPAPQSVTPTTP
jgi:hypothetical protein